MQIRLNFRCGGSCLMTWTNPQGTSPPIFVSSLHPPRQRFQMLHHALRRDQRGIDAIKSRLALES